MKKRGKKIFSLLASLLEYPTERTAGRVREAIEMIDFINPAARIPLERFREYCRTKPAADVQSLYVRTFHLNGACCPYVGHHLFGDERSRILFAAKLKERFPAHVAARSEAPDHLAVILRSLVVQESVEEARELVCRCLIPAVKKMIALFQDRENPYRAVLQAVLITLATEEGQTPPAEAQTEYALAEGRRNQGRE